MADKTGIEWTDATWNPIRGCSRVSEGCRNCYAERMAARFSGPGMPYDGLIKLTANGPRWNGSLRLVADHLADPLRWQKPRRIFVNSMSDLFHESLTNEQIAAVFGVMAAAPRHTFQVLTKRPARMAEWFRWVTICRGSTPYVAHESSVVVRAAEQYVGGLGVDCRWPLPNVWLGVSVENQSAADERIPLLLQTPAAVRFLSCEPLLGPVDIPRHDQSMGASHSPLDWVIAGCESGPGARPAEVDWYRSLRDQCAATGVAFFLKQSFTETVDRVAPDGVGGFHDPIAAGAGSKLKPRGLIAAPYLDGVQHVAFPETTK